MESLEKLRLHLNRLCMVIGGVSVIGLMLVAAANVILRMFGMPFSGTYEVVGFLGALTCAFALGESQRRKDHVVVDIVSAHYRQGLARAVDVAQYVAGIFLFSVVAWKIFVYGMTISRTGEVSETLKMDYHWFVYAVAVCFGLLALNLVVDALAVLCRRREDKP